jgi:hypothetical protein
MQYLVEFMLKTREEAESVIDTMRTMIDRRKMVSVGELYDMVGLPATFKDDERGWTDLADTSVRQVQGGYVLDLPNTTPLT